MQQFNVKFGPDVSSKTSLTPLTVWQVKADPNLKAVLGFGDNMRALINGVEIGDDVQVPNGATLLLETKANSKAE